ncbi:copy number control protein [Dolichospermum flos-aquae]|uniref:Copy number control protein n=1 Tax=Dolichospermum flos-aquae CCAP 1403/13F TaxID=315271 RepID=A0A6H2BXG7_DOLFA|nr:copy number control protein [Dolichospermum flos-aquae]QJB44272.1 copy number control protein [Dolichospermum flos-aquae CCAP 1403/13F]
MDKNNEKVNKTDMVQVRVSLPEDYRRLFKAYCTEQNTDMSKRITELVETELKTAGKI